MAIRNSGVTDSFCREDEKIIVVRYDHSTRRSRIIEVSRIGFSAKIGFDSRCDIDSVSTERFGQCRRAVFVQMESNRAGHGSGYRRDNSSVKKGKS